MARQQVKDSHPIPAYAVLPLKGKTKRKKLTPPLSLKEFFFLCPPLEGRGTASSVVGWQKWQAVEANAGSNKIFFDCGQNLMSAENLLLMVLMRQGILT